MATAEQLVDTYVQLRDRKKAIQDKHKEELAPINELMYKIEMGLLDALNNDGAQSIKTSAGTAYKKIRTNAKVVDWNTTLPYIIEHDLTHMLVQKLGSASVAEFVEANGTAPPGVSITSDLTVGIRRS